MNSTELDLYFERTGYRGPRTPNLEVLHALTAAHTQTIPFENLDVLLGRGIDLDFNAVFDKLVRRRRGGYCFEQNWLFLNVLQSLGFAATPLSARVRLDRPRDFIPPRTHMFIRVALDGTAWLTDVGVGASSLTSAISFDSAAEQPTPHEPRRIVRESGRCFHQVRFGDDWHDVYEFTGEEMPEIDREVGNWFTSAHPKSHFKNRLIVARAGTEARRYTLLNREFKIRERDGHAKVRPVESAKQLLELLDEFFGLRFPDGTHFGDAPDAPWPIT
ncbi:MAG TPA: arylamine N-acetyltransferase [Polyangiales bacterium]|nr:arylamine N-acetyltransferase [Polyangiales bacterium]